MSELAEKKSRQRQIAEQMAGTLTAESCQGCDQCVELIEQALLAERKSAWEEAAKIVDAGATCFAEFNRDECFHDSAICPDIQEIAEKVRAAAEKEVQK